MVSKMNNKQNITQHFFLIRQEDSLWGLFHRQTGYYMGVAYKYIKKARETARILEQVNGINWDDTGDFMLINAGKRVQRKVANTIRQSVGLPIRGIQ